LENNKPDDIKRAITSLSEAFQRKEAKEFPVLAKEHFSEDDIARATKLVEQHDPEAFSRNFRHADDVIEGLLMLAGVDDRKSRFVFREYTFLERHVTNVITQYEGLHVQLIRAGQLCVAMSIHSSLALLLFLTSNKSTRSTCPKLCLTNISLFTIS